MALKKSSKLKSQKSRKAWEMVRAGTDYKTIGIEVGYTATAIKLFAVRKYKDESEKLWAAEIKAIGHCEICLKNIELNAHHLLPKSIWTNLDRDLSNGICLCTDHHTMNPQISPHNNIASGEEFLKWLEEYRPGQFAWYNEHKLDRKYIGNDYELAYNTLKE
jgi:hypothetical protein